MFWYGYLLCQESHICIWLMGSVMRQSYYCYGTHYKIGVAHTLGQWVPELPKMSWYHYHLCQESHICISLMGSVMGQKYYCNGPHYKIGVAHTMGKWVLKPELSKIFWYPYLLCQESYICILVMVYVMRQLYYCYGPRYKMGLAHMVGQWVLKQDLPIFFGILNCFAMKATSASH